MIGTRVGPYEITGELGQGSMGLVYAGRRADGHFEKDVAIKFIKAGTNHEQLMKRFDLERRILASLEHPNIARLLDAGTLKGTGQPYFVLEKIEGMAIDQYCRHHELSVDDRVQLFSKVCHAIHFAHQKLIIHRDIKPSNIMVNDEGEPKILDFGIAKFIGDDSAATREQGQRPMTPRYASPEQVNGEVLTTSTDIYSLGVLFYEILTGLSPYEKHTERHLASQILSSEPKPPSRALLSNASLLTQDDATELSPTAEGKRRPQVTVSIRTIRRKIKGDLDNIVLMSLRKNPNRRYSSVLQLKEDLDNYLAGYPVLAHKESKVYHLKKLVLRNKAATALVALFLLSTFGFYLKDRNDLKMQIKRNQEVSHFLVNLFSAADPLEGRGKELTAREIIDQGIGTLADEFGNQDDIKMTLYHAFGVVYRNMGLPNEAEESLQKALNLHKTIADASVLEKQKILSDLALVIDKKGRHQEALSLLEQSLQDAGDLAGAQHETTVDIGFALDKVYRRMSRTDEALALFQKGLEYHNKEHGPESQQVADAMTEICTAQRKKDLYKESRETCEKALAITMENLGSEHPKVGRLKNSLAAISLMLSDYEKSIRYQNEALAIYEKTLGEAHSMTLSGLTTLGMIYGYKGEFAQSLEILRKGLVLREKHFGKENIHYITLKNNISMMQLQSGKLNEAIKTYEEAIPMATQRFGKKHSLVVAMNTNLAEAYVQTGQPELAIKTVNSILNDPKVVPEVKPSVYISLLQRLANAHSRMEKYEDAIKTYIKVVELSKEHYGHDDPTTATATVRLGLEQIKLGLWEDAESSFKTAEKHLRPDVKSEQVAIERIAFGRREIQKLQ